MLCRLARGRHLCIDGETDELCSVTTCLPVRCLSVCHFCSCSRKMVSQEFAFEVSQAWISCSATCHRQFRRDHRCDENTASFPCSGTRFRGHNRDNWAPSCPLLWTCEKSFRFQREEVTCLSGDLGAVSNRYEETNVKFEWNIGRPWKFLMTMKVAP